MQNCDQHEIFIIVDRLSNTHEHGGLLFYHTIITFKSICENFRKQNWHLASTFDMQYENNYVYIPVAY